MYKVAATAQAFTETTQHKQYNYTSIDINNQQHNKRNIIIPAYNVQGGTILATDCSVDSKKCRSRLLKQVEAHLSGQTVEGVLVVFLDIRSAAVAKKIIDTKIYESVFDQFVAHVWEVRQKIAEK
jgi:hypothetical protein